MGTGVGVPVPVKQHASSCHLCESVHLNLSFFGSCNAHSPRTAQITVLSDMCCLQNWSSAFWLHPARQQLRSGASALSTGRECGQTTGSASSAADQHRLVAVTRHDLISHGISPEWQLQAEQRKASSKMHRLCGPKGNSNFQQGMQIMLMQQL